MQRPIGLILAGGAARRMGGGDKSLRLLGGRSVLARVVERLTPQCCGLLLSANGAPDRFAGFGLRVVPDHVEDRGTGPLAGLLAGLEVAAATHPRADDVVVVAADMPFLPPDLVVRLAAARPTGSAVAAARSRGQPHPLASLWRTTAIDALRDALRRQGERRVRAVAETLGVAWVDWPDLHPDPFLNLNTPADVALAEHALPDAISKAR